MQQNDFVFHGTQEKNLRQIEPVLIEGHPKPFVFASRYKAIAACFLLPKDPEWMCVFYTQNGLVRFVAGNHQRLERENKGGSLYMLSGTEFFHSEHEGMEYMEWLAEKPQQVIHESAYPCAIRAMQMNGVKMSHLSPAVFKAMRDKVGTDPFILCTDRQMQEMHEFIETHRRRIAA